MKTFFTKIGVIIATVVLALVSLSTVFLVNRVSAANLGEPSGPDNPVNEYPSTWVVVAGYTGTLHMVNTASNNVYGPFLAGQLGSENGGLFDVAVTPNGKIALVGNFGDGLISFVDVSNPLNPSLMATVTLTFNNTSRRNINTPAFLVEDIAITQNGKYALVTDGKASNIVFTLDIGAREIVTHTNLGNNYAQAVAIAPDGTVVFADFERGVVHSYLLDDNGYLTYGSTVTYTINEKTGAIDPTGSQTGVGWKFPEPVNVGISPDGETVIICDSEPYSYTYGSDYRFPYNQIGAYRITAPGILSFTQAITGLTSGDYQSVAFSPSGDKAYLYGNHGWNIPTKNNHITVLDITGPGEISLNNQAAAEIPTISNSSLFGVDSITVIHNKAYVSHESRAYPPEVSKNNIYMVDLDTNDVLTITLPGLKSDVFSMGVAAIPYLIYVPFLIQQ